MIFKEIAIMENVEAICHYFKNRQHAASLPFRERDGCKMESIPRHTLHTRPPNACRKVVRVNAAGMSQIHSGHWFNRKDGSHLKAVSPDILPGLKLLGFCC